MADSLTDLHTLGQLIRLVTHDLRNPLAVIISNLGYLGNVVGQASDDVRETIADTLTSSEDLKHIIENLDLLGQTLVGGAPSSPRSMAIAAATSEVLNRTEPFARSHGVALAITLPLSADAARVEAPPELFERAVANLIRNAISHSPSGSEVRVGLEIDQESCSVVVRDKGTPFDATHPERMFDAKGQISAKTELAGRYSRGLGLLIARIAAEGCGAKVSASASSASASSASASSAPASSASTDAFRNVFALRFKRA